MQKGTRCVERKDDAKKGISLHKFIHVYLSEFGTQRPVRYYGLFVNKVQIKHPSFV